jgi:sugar phosphate isomerase/epimerase
MRLGFVSAILHDLSFWQVIDFAAANKFACVELMAWPVGKAERRYAGVTHIDAANLNPQKANSLLEYATGKNVEICGLGYHPNPLVADRVEAQVYIGHLERVIEAAVLLHVPVVSTFIGRDQYKSVDDNWPRFLEVWRPLIKFAEDYGVKVAIENCAMLFGKDQWPGGQNLATSPVIWRRMFEAIPSENFGLELDPSHMIWQMMDVIAAIRGFGSKILRVHAKDARLDRHKLAEAGILSYPLDFHTPKIPGYGDVDWGRFFSALTDAGYDGPVCIEVEDRAFEKTLFTRQAALLTARNYLSKFLT